MISVIIIEDENRIREGFMRLIDWNAHGFEIIGSARNGKDGLFLIETLHPDLVFVDINMPIMSGLEMLEKTKDTQDFEAIVVSGYDDFEYAQNAIKLKVFDYLLKPVLKEELVAVLERYKKEHGNKEYSQEIQDKLNEVLTIPTVFGDLMVIEAIKYIDENLSETITATGMAEMLHVSISKLNDTFLVETGHTFHKFLTRYRVRKAMELFIDSNLLVYEVGEKVGFPDYKYFGQIFKRHTNINVSEFRKSILYTNEGKLKAQT